MEEQHEQEHVGRRRLLRGAGAVVAGVAGAGVAGAVAATPAQAADGDQVLVGKVHTGATATSIELEGDGSTTQAALRLRNANGPALHIEPVPSSVPSTTAPLGSVFVDQEGDVWTVGTQFGVKTTNLLYSPSWATQTFPIKPVRVLDTRTANRGNFRGGVIDSAGRVSGNGFAFIRLSSLVQEGAGVQMNVTTDRAVANGFVTVWGGGALPNSSSLNFSPAAPISNFVQAAFGIFEGHLGVSVFVSRQAALIIDVVGLIVFNQFTDIPAGVLQANGVSAARVQSTAKSRGRQPEEYQPGR